MVIRSRISKDRQYNGEKEKDKGQIMIHKTLHRKTSNMNPTQSPCAPFYYFSSISLD